MCKSFDVMRENHVWKKYIGVDRSTFLINSNGLVEKNGDPLRLRSCSGSIASVKEI